MFLGYLGDLAKHPASSAKNYDWLTSKFGGSAKVLQDAIQDAFQPPSSDGSLESPAPSSASVLSTCECCKKPLTLIAQVHAPRILCPVSQPPTGLAAIAENSVLSPNYKPPQGETDDEVRVLIILACNEKRCWKLGRATWKAYRFQPHVVVDQAEVEAKKAAKAAAFRKTLHTPVVDDEDDKLSAKKTPTVTPTKTLFSTPTWGSPFGGSSFSSSKTESPSTSSGETTQTKDLEELLKLRDLSIAPKVKTPQSKSSGQNRATSSPKASPSQPPATPSKEDELLAISSATTSQPEETGTQFKEAFIEFDKEPEIATYSSNADEEDDALTQQYKKKVNEGLSEGADGTWAGEGYESAVSAKDRPFHRFHKRLQRSPEQCLRYWRGAEPLLCSADRPKAIPHCSNCGAPRVPETQLTPALIYMLTPINEKDEINIDFGTVIVHTCLANCTKESQPLFPEHIMLQRGM